MSRMQDRIDRQEEYFQSRRNPLKALEFEIVRRVRRVKAEASCTSVPTDLSKLASHLGIIDIRSCPLTTAGRIVDAPEGRIIEVNSGDSPERQNFSVAHELGHLIVEELGVFSGQLHRVTPLYQRPKFSSKMERLCDVAAAEILVPITWLRNLLRRKAPSITTVGEIAHECRTSLEVASRRVAAAGIWHCRFIWWDWDGKNLQATKAYPPYHRQTLLWLRPKDCSSSLICRSIRDQKILAGREVLLVENEEHEFITEAWGLSQNTAMSLILHERYPYSPRRLTEE